MSGFAGNERWKGTYDLNLMKDALSRFHSVGARSPVRKTKASVLLANGPVRDAMISLQSGRVLLVVFSLASPSSVRTWSDLNSILRQGRDEPAKVYAVTTYQLNDAIDAGDKEAIVQGLRKLRARLSPATPIYIVPDRELQAFGLDSYPSVVAMTGTRIIILRAIWKFGRDRR